MAECRSRINLIWKIFCATAIALVLLSLSLFIKGFLASEREFVSFIEGGHNRKVAIKSISLPEGFARDRIYIESRIAEILPVLNKHIKSQQGRKYSLGNEEHWASIEVIVPVNMLLDNGDYFLVKLGIFDSNGMASIEFTPSVFNLYKERYPYLFVFQ